MTTDKPEHDPEALNPRYAGATPKQVVATLMRLGREAKLGDDSEKKGDFS